MTKKQRIAALEAKVAELEKQIGALHLSIALKQDKHPANQPPPRIGTPEQWPNIPQPYWIGPYVVSCKEAP